MFNLHSSQLVGLVALWWVHNIYLVETFWVGGRKLSQLPTLFEAELRGRESV